MLQRTIGNAAVRGLAGQRIDREGPTATAPATQERKKPALLPAGVTHRWIGSGLHIVLVASVPWLKKRGATGRRNPGSVVDPAWPDVVKVAPWITAADIKSIQGSDQDLTLPKDWESRGEVIVRFDRHMMARIGLPPRVAVRGRIDGKGLFLLVSGAVLRQYADDQTSNKIHSPEVNELIYAEIERLTRAPIPAAERRILVELGSFTLNKPINRVGKNYVLTLSEKGAASLVGRKVWSKALEKPVNPASQEAAVGGTGVFLPPGYEEHFKKLTKILDEFVKKAPPGSDPSKLIVTSRLADLLLSLNGHPRRAELVAKLKAGGGTAVDISMADTVETLLAQDAITQTTKDLDLTLGSGSRGKPLVARPVRGTIVNNSGVIIPSKEATFSFKVHDDVDRFAVPRIRIKWVAHRKGDPKRWVADEGMSYSPLKGDGFLNDRTFDVTFARTGDYVIRAVVEHNFFQHNVFRQEVRVKDEDQVLRGVEKKAMAGFKGHSVSGAGRNFEIGSVTDGVTGYGVGWMEKGKIDPKFKPPTLDDRIASLEAEVKRIDELRKQYASKTDRNSRSVVSWADDYLEGARASIKKITREGKSEGQHHIPAVGAYVSRTNGVPTGPMNLVCLLRSTSDGWRVTVHDASQLVSAENFRFAATGSDIQKAYEAAFLAVTQGYPDGKMSIGFQVWDSENNKLTDDYVKFERRTDTAWKDVKEKVFGTVVDIAVNVTAAMMTVFPPTTLIGLSVAVAYNAGKTAAELEASYARGTLTNTKILGGIGQVALDVIPFAGTSRRVVMIGRKAFYVIEGTQLVGQAYLVTADGLRQVEHLRNGVIKQLADVEQEIREIERVNRSDPRLDVLRKKQKKLIADGKSATLDTFSKLIATQSIMVAGGAAIQNLARKGLGDKIASLETSNRFQDKPGATPHYDPQQRRIVADKNKITPEVLGRLEHQRQLDDQLVDVVPDASARQQIIEELGTADIEIRKQQARTKLDQTATHLVLDVKKGASPADILAQAKRVSATAARPGSAKRKDKRSAPAGTAVSPKEVTSDFGMPPQAAVHAATVMKDFGTVMEVRAANEWAPDLYAQGARPKPEWMKNKTLNELDLYLGMNREHLGKAAHFKPVKPKRRLPDMSDRTWKAINEAYKKRLRSYRALKGKIAKMEASGKITVSKDGVILDPDGKPFTGDFDIYRFRNVDGTPLTAAKSEAVLDALRNGPFAAQHGAQVDWEPKTKFEQEIYDTIIGAHMGGGEGLLRIGPDGAFTVSYH